MRGVFAPDRTGRATGLQLVVDPPIQGRWTRLANSRAGEAGKPPVVPLLRTVDVAALLAADDVSIEGDVSVFRQMLEHLDDFAFWFDIVTP